MNELGDERRDPSVSAPEGLPVLSRGRHLGPDQGSCVMEYVSVLAGARWSDHPRCTEPALGELARRVNDDVRTSSRPALALVAPRLVGAAGRRGATDVVIVAVVRVGLDLAPEDPVLLRIRRRALARLAHAERASGEPWRTEFLGLGRLPVTIALGTAYAHLGRVLRERPRDERDAARIRALAAAVEDVRRHVGAPEAPRPGVVADVPAEPVASGPRR